MFVSLYAMVKTLSKSIGGNDRAYTNGLLVYLILNDNGVVLRDLTSQLDIYCAVVVTSPAYQRLSIAWDQCINRHSCC